MSFIVGGAIIGGLGIAGALIGSHASQGAAETQANAANNAAQIGQNEFNTITQQETPFMQGGYGALGQLQYLMGIGQPQQQNPMGGAYPIDPSSGYMLRPNGGIGVGMIGNVPQTGPGMPTMGGEPQSINPSLSNSFLPPGYTMRNGSIIGPDGKMFQGDLGALFAQQQPQTATAAAPPTMGYQQGMPLNQFMGAQGVQGTQGSTAGGFGSLLAPFTADTFKQLSPAYNFQLGQGQQGVLNRDASGQGAMSGAALKDLMSFNQNLANTSFDTAFNQYQTQQGNVYNRLMGLSQLGQNAAANTGAQGTNLAGQIGQSVTNAGSASAAGQIGAANAWSGGLQMAALPWLMQGMKGGG